MKEKFKISEVTISKTFKKIEQYKNILTNDALTDKLAKILEDDQKNIVMPNKLKLMYNSINKSESNNENNEDDKNSEKIEESESIESIESIDESESSKDEVIFKKKFDRRKDDIDEYIDNINIELYDILSITDDIYNKFINDII